MVTLKKNMWTSDIEILDKTKPLLFLGDHHGNWGDLFHIITSKKIENCYLISVGDSGIGFKPNQEQVKNINELQNEFSEYKEFKKPIPEKF